MKKWKEKALERGLGSEIADIGRRWPSGLDGQRGVCDSILCPYLPMMIAI